MIAAFLLAAVAARPLPFDARVEATRALERARYRFVIGATKPFDELYARKVFVDRVRRMLDEERILQRRFGVVITPEMLDDEYKRIEVMTKDQDQWDAMKAVLGNDRSFIEEVVCRPLLADRLLRVKFGFDQEIHAGPHQQARAARALFLAGEKVPAARRLVLDRAVRGGATTEEMLEQSKKEATGPRETAPRAGKEESLPRPVDSEMARILERELLKAGDVTTILEDRERFSVFRLIELRPDRWIVQAVTFPKIEFDAWFDRERKT